MTDNLGRIHKDFARITSNSVDPGGSINIQLRKVVGGEGGEGGLIDIQLRKDLRRLCKDYHLQCSSWGRGEVDQQST